MSFNKYCYSIAITSLTAFMLNGHIKLTFVHNCVKRQPIAISSSNVIAICARNKYVHQIGHICQIQCYTCQISDKYIWKMYTHTFATYAVSGIIHVTRSTVHIFDTYHWTNMATTLQIKLTHATCNGSIQTLQFADTYQNKINCNIFFTFYCQICVKKYTHHTGHIYIYIIFDGYIWLMYMYICATYKVTGIKCGTRSTIHIIDIHY